MHNIQGGNQNILITGGSSGLGLELVRLFLKEGFNVVATGRREVKLDGFENRFTLYNIDFNDLKQVASETEKICSNHSFNIVINNAGILSPPEYTETTDGYEYTFQINFLAHLLINEIIVNAIKDQHSIKIASVTSPLYRFASPEPVIERAGEYKPMRSYSSSKLYLAMMSDLIASRHRETSLMCFSFDPGTFSSGIYRMQKSWFRSIYRVAAPFMRSPVKVAKVLTDLILDDETVFGKIYDISKNQRSVPEMDKNRKTAFIDLCYDLIDPFLG